MPFELPLSTFDRARARDRVATLYCSGRRRTAANDNAERRSIGRRLDALDPQCKGLYLGKNISETALRRTLKALASEDLVGVTSDPADKRNWITCTTAQFDKLLQILEQALNVKRPTAR